MRKGLTILLLCCAFLAGAHTAHAANPFIFGIDVSNNQVTPTPQHCNDTSTGTIDWNAVANDPQQIRFVLARASCGSAPDVDSKYAEFKTGATGAGLVFTAYHVAYPSGSTDAERASDATNEA